MNSMLDFLWHGLHDTLLMGWTVWWALVFGFLISGVVQAWIPRARIERALSGPGVGPVAKATALGAASSSCSYAATAISKSLFQKGASAVSAIAFQFASTNLVWELGFVLWVLIGWQFTLAEFVGGLLMIAMMALLLRLFISPRLEAAAREHAVGADTGHQHHMAGQSMLWRERLTSARAWSDVAHNFRGDWQMLYKEIAIGLLLGGFVAQFGNSFFHSLFLTGSPKAVQVVWSALIGPVIAMLSSVCSVGNVPLAAVLWSGGISFAGVIAFIFADLIILPIVAIYRKYYGRRYALRLVGLLFTTMVLSAIVVELVFSAFGLIPGGARPDRGDIFGHISLNYKFYLNLIASVVFLALFALTVRRGATDPVCHMQVDRASAAGKSVHAGRTYYFCSEFCLEAFEADPSRYLGGGGGTMNELPASGLLEVAMVGYDSTAKHGLEVSKAVGGGHHDPMRQTAGTGVIDPVCGMSVDPATAPMAEHDGRRYFFCCEGCRERFMADPAAFLAD